MRKRVVIEASEEEQMRLAIENSLRETQAKDATGLTSYDCEDDNDDVITIDSETEGDDVEEIISYESHLGGSDGKYF